MLLRQKDLDQLILQKNFSSVFYYLVKFKNKKRKGY